MCLIVFAFRQHPDYELIVLANRDEYHDRASAPLHPWPQGFYAGRDTLAGGSWIGIHPEGRFAAVTNVRQGPPQNGQRSRGHLVTTFLSSASATMPPEAADQYSGFNLITGIEHNDGWRLSFVSNRFQFRSLEPGIYGLSNGDLDAPWPKVMLAKSRLQALLQQSAPPSLAWLSALDNRQIAPDHTLPDTGIGLVKERWLSPCFIVSGGYGTVSSTVLAWGKSHRLIAERRYDANGQIADETAFHDV